MYTPPFNFGGLEDQYCNYDNSCIVVVPVPFEKTTSWIKGTEKGPERIIDASRYVELYDIDTNIEVYKRGIFTAQPINAKNEDDLIKRLSENINKYIDDKKFPVFLGGEHTVTFGCIKPFVQRNKDISVLILDAHADFRDMYEDNIYSHACVAKRISELGINLVQAGIRSMDSSELNYIDKKHMFFAKDIYGKSEWMTDVLKLLSDQVYISIDLDVFDPSVIPSVGTPEPGGLFWYDVVHLLKNVIISKEVLAFDVVELCPDSVKYSDFTAAKLIYTILSYIFNKKKT